MLPVLRVDTCSDENTLFSHHFVQETYKITRMRDIKKYGYQILKKNNDKKLSKNLLMLFAAANSGIKSFLV